MLNFQHRSQGFFFERKGKRLGLLSSHKRSPGYKVVIFFKENHFSVNIENETAKQEKFL